MQNETDETYECELCYSHRRYGTPEGGSPDDWPTGFSMPDPSDHESGLAGCCCKACAVGLHEQVRAVHERYPHLEADNDRNEEEGRDEYRCGLCGELRRLWTPEGACPSMLEVHADEWRVETMICRACTCILAMVECN